MVRLLASIKALITRLVFATHGVIAIWQVTIFKKNVFYWYLCSPIILLFFEGLFTLTIKENQEWKWFCPSVFLYLGSVVPAIWLLELDKVDRRLKTREETFNLTASAGANLKDLNNLIGVQIKLPDINTETWITLIEQFLMLILIIGRWMLPKGDLTRDQLSQILLVYIGTAADIIEFFDSFKDDKVAGEPILVMLTLGIWTWSLMQFTVVLTATKARKSRMSSTGSPTEPSRGFCNIDVCGIAINITLQDAPFLAFRLLIITHYQIISYMNVFFTCKNTLVILLQLYRLHVVYTEHRKSQRKDELELTSIAIISKPNMYGCPRGSPKKYKTKNKRVQKEKYLKAYDLDKCESEDEPRRNRKSGNHRKDTGYSTASSYTSNKGTSSKSRRRSIEEERIKSRDSKQRLQRSDQDTKGYKRRHFDIPSEASESDVPATKRENFDYRKDTPRKCEKRIIKDVTTESATNSDPSSD